MPSIEETCVLSASNSTTTPDFFAREMEELVSEIKENLRLSGFKSRPSFKVHHKSRASPYQIPSKSWGESSCEDCVKSPSNACGGHSCVTLNKKLSKSKDSTGSSRSDDPYEMLQELLRDGSLIKEAVRRLQKGLSPKQRFFYDSDEDSRTPLRVCHLEL